MNLLIDFGDRSVSRTAITPLLPHAGEGWDVGPFTTSRRIIKML